MTTTKQHRAQATPDQGNDLHPAQELRNAARKSYRRIENLVLVLALLSVAVLLWGFACSYQVGFSAGSNQCTEVNHD